MHVQALVIKHHINVSLGEVVNRIPKMEVQSSAGDLAREGWELPGGSIMAMNFQLAIHPACVHKTPPHWIYMTDKADGIYCHVIIITRAYSVLPCVSAVV